MSGSQKARPLHDLVKKDQKWNQEEKQEKVFGELKKRFIQELVLTIPNLDEDRSRYIRLCNKRSIR